MKLETLIPLLILSVSLTATQIASYPLPEFTLISSDLGIELFEKWIILEGESDRREVMLTVQISAPVDEVIHVLMDEKFGLQWNSHVDEYKIDFHTKGKWISYAKYSFPFPLLDRECYLANYLVENEKNKTIFFKSIESRKFSNGEIVQINGLEGSWIARTRDGGTYLEYHVIAVPDSSLPRWLVDPVIRRSLRNTIYNLRETIEKN